VLQKLDRGNGVNASAAPTLYNDCDGNTGGGASDELNLCRERRADAPGDLRGKQRKHGNRDVPMDNGAEVNRDHSDAALEFKRGTRLRHPLYDANGMLLLAAGAEVTPRFLSVLERRGIHVELQASITVVAGNPLGLEIPIKHDWLTVGRRPDCDVRPDSDAVSNRHCRFYRRKFGVYLTDLNSTNGTYVNDQRIVGDVELSDGDLVRVGPMAFQVGVYMAVAADNDDDQRALDAWVLAEPFASGPPGEPGRGPTVGVRMDSIIFRKPIGKLPAAPPKPPGPPLFPPK
jgi:hypothetical protein